MFIFSLGGSLIDTVDIFGGALSVGFGPRFHGLSLGGGASYKEHIIRLISADKITHSTSIRKT